MKREIAECLVLGLGLLVTAVQGISQSEDTHWSRAEVQCLPDNSSNAIARVPAKTEVDCTAKASPNSEPKDFLAAQFNHLTRTCSVFNYSSICHQLIPGQTPNCEVFYRFPINHRAFNAKINNVWLADDVNRLENQVCQQDEDTNRLHPVGIQWTSEGALFDGSTAYAVLNKSSLNFASGLTWLVRLKRQPTSQPFFEFANCSDMGGITGHGIHMWEVTDPMRLMVRANRITGGQLPVVHSDRAMSPSSSYWLNLGFTAAGNTLNLFVNDSFVPRASLDENLDSDAAWVDNSNLCLYLGMRVDHSSNPKFTGTLRALAFASSNMTEAEIREFFDLIG